MQKDPRSPSHAVIFTAAMATCLVGFSLACSSSAPEVRSTDADAATQSARRADRIWSFDLSDETVESMTLEQLWQVGVESLQWPGDMPADASKTDIHARLMEAKYREVGGFDNPDELEGLGYEGE